jgi:hypothetical protein
LSFEIKFLSFFIDLLLFNGWNKEILSEILIDFSGFFEKSMEDKVS